MCFDSRQNKGARLKHMAHDQAKCKIANYVIASYLFEERKTCKIRHYKLFMALLSINPLNKISPSTAIFSKRIWNNLEDMQFIRITT